MGKIKAIKGLGKAFLESGKKKKTLTVDKGAARIAEINRKIKNAHRYARKGLHEDHAQEVYDIYAGKWKGKK